MGRRKNIEIVSRGVTKGNNKRKFVVLNVKRESVTPSQIKKFGKERLSLNVGKGRSRVLLYQN